MTNDESDWVVDVNLDGAMYRRFCRYDTWLLGRRWVRPLIFAIMLLAFSAVCFGLSGSFSGATLLGIVLAVVGVGLPAVYFASDHMAVTGRIKKFRLDGKKKRHANRVTLSPRAGVTIETGKGDPLALGWPALYGAHRGKGVVYLYTEAKHAFILPDDSGEVWRMISAAGVRALP